MRVMHMEKFVILTGRGGRKWGWIGPGSYLPWQTCPWLLWDLSRCVAIGRAQVTILCVKEHHVRRVALALWVPLETAGSVCLRLFSFWQAQYGLIRQTTGEPLDKFRKSSSLGRCHGVQLAPTVQNISLMSSVPHVQNNNWNVCCLLHSHMFVIKVQL